MVIASSKENSDTFHSYFGNSPTSTPHFYQGVNSSGEVESRALTYDFGIGCMLYQ